MFAIIETGGKQYKVQEGDTIFVEKLNQEEGAFSFDKVLLINSDDKTIVGDPYISGASVDANLVKNGKFGKILVFKFKAKKNYRRRQGHRQPYSKVEIKKINL